MIFKWSLCFPSCPSDCRCGKVTLLCPAHTRPVTVQMLTSRWCRVCSLHYLLCPGGRPGKILGCRPYSGRIPDLGPAPCYAGFITDHPRIPTLPVWNNVEILREIALLRVGFPRRRKERNGSAGLHKIIVFRYPIWNVPWKCVNFYWSNLQPKEENIIISTKLIIFFCFFFTYFAFKGKKALCIGAISY